MINTPSPTRVVCLAQYVGWFRFVHLLNLDLLTHKIGRKSLPLSRLCEIHKLTLTPVNVVVVYSELVPKKAKPLKTLTPKNYHIFGILRT